MEKSAAFQRGYGDMLEKIAGWSDTNTGNYGALLALLGGGVGLMAPAKNWKRRAANAVLGALLGGGAGSLGGGFMDIMKHNKDNEIAIDAALEAAKAGVDPYMWNIDSRDVSPAMHDALRNVERIARRR